MQFKSEQERRRHPVAGFIPDYAWWSVFKDKKMMSNEELKVMSLPWAEAKTYITELLTNPHIDKLKIALCLAYRLPKVDDGELVPVIQNMGLDTNLFAAFTGRTAFLDINDLMWGRLQNLFAVAVSCGHVDVMDNLINKMSQHPAFKERSKDSIEEVFQKAIDYGQSESLDRVIRLAKEHGVMLKEFMKTYGFDSFGRAAIRGHTNVMNKLKEFAPEHVLEMIRYQHYSVYKTAANKGYIDVIDKLVEFAPELVSDVIDREGGGIFFEASFGGHVNVIDKLIELAPNDMPAKIAGYRGQRALMVAAREGRTDFANRLLTFPDLLDHAEMHWEYDRYVKPFIAGKLKSLHSRHAAGHPSIVVTQQEATSCFIILLHLMRETPSKPETLAEIDFLMSIPVVRSLLHRPILSHPANALLREAIRLNNQPIIERLYDIAEVRAQAERDEFYQEESRGGVDLRVMAQNIESSMSALSPQEQAMLQRLEEKYKPAIDEIGLDKAFNEVFEAIKARYNQSPASFMRGNEAIVLPLNKHDFDNMAIMRHFSEDDINNACKAYYQHPTHTVFRYLSKPNPWMAKNSGYVEVDRNTGARWSTFEAYKNLITLIWKAACDLSQVATDGFTVASRVDEVIHEIALIARAHNWDSTRNKIDNAGNPMLDLSGKPIKEAYDDLEGDKPSCYSGVKRRLFQALKGHPLFISSVQEAISQGIHQRLRDHMKNQFKESRTTILEELQADYIKMTQGESIETLPVITSSWDVPEEVISEWGKELQEQYGASFGKETVQSLIKQELDSFFKQAATSSHFLALSERCQLIPLYQSELKTRTDTLIKQIQALKPEERVAFLNSIDEVTNQSQLVNAIHLGLLGEVGVVLKTEAFTQLICPDSATGEFYADILSTYTNDARLNDWLSVLNEEDRASLIALVHKAAAERSTLTPIEKFKIFMRGVAAAGAIPPADKTGFNLLYKQVQEFKSSNAEFEKLLDTWIGAHPKNHLIPKIYEKANELKITLSNAPDAVSAQVKQEQNEVVSNNAPMVTFEMLPDDPTGRLLLDIEKGLLRPQQDKSERPRVGFFDERATRPLSLGDGNQIPNAPSVGPNAG